MAKKRTVKRRRNVGGPQRRADGAETARSRRCLGADAGRAHRRRRRRRARALPRAARRDAGRCSRRCRSTCVEPTPYQRDPSEPHVKRLMHVLETLGRFLDPIIAVRHEDTVLDAERQSSPAGDAQARREGDRRARGAGSRSRVQDPRAEHREGAQPEGEVARNDPHASRARRTALVSRPNGSSPSSSTSRRSSRSARRTSSAHA